MIPLGCSYRALQIHVGRFSHVVGLTCRPIHKPFDFSETGRQANPATKTQLTRNQLCRIEL